MAVVAIFLFRPYVFEGKVLAQGDNQRARAMQTEIQKYREIDGHAPLWTNAMFSGMPAYMIWHYPHGNLARYLTKPLLWWQSITIPHTMVLLAMFMGYLALVMFGMDWRIALFGGVSYGISTYFVDLAEAGHSTKMLAMAYVPAIWASAWLLLRQRWLLGTGMLALLVGLQIAANHVQITYYTYLLLGIGVLIYGIQMIRSGHWKNWAIAVALMGAGTGLGALSNIAMLWPAYEYAAETIRGESELREKADKGDGLTKEYAFDWSYGIDESMTLLIPNFMGGGASHSFAGTATYDRLYPVMMNNFTQQGMSRAQAQKSAEQQVAALFYHGDQPFVGTAIYFGAGILFLFVLGALVLSGPVRWWLLAAALFALTISWGKHFFLNDILFDHFPLFNKFRAVSMALGLSHIAIVLLAMMGLQRALQMDRSHLEKAVIRALAITGGLTLIGWILGSSMDMIGANDSAVGPELARLLVEDRAAVLRSDALRSLLIIALIAGLLIAYARKALRLPLALGLVAAIAVIDVWLVDSRILFPAKFESARQVAADPQPSPADARILDDPDPHYRVLDLRSNPFTNAQTSHFHKSIGGYHAAKLMKYQELIEQYLINPGQNLPVVGMLNTKYIIQEQEGQSRAFPVQEAKGNAWFVQNLKTVPDADNEIRDLNFIDLNTTAVLQTSALPNGWPTTYLVDSSATVQLTTYHPDTLRYQYSTSQPGFLVFSEVYYPPSKGWQVYLNGEPFDDFIKVNYVLRGLQVSAGSNQEIMMVFHPRSVYTGSTWAAISSLLSLFLFAGGLFFHFRDQELGDPSILQEPATEEKGKKGRKRKA